MPLKSLKKMKHSKYHIKNGKKGISMKLKLLVLSLLATSSVYANNYPTVQLHPVTILVEHVKAIPTTHLGTQNAMCSASANAASGTGNTNITVSGYVNYTIT